MDERWYEGGVATRVLKAPRIDFSGIRRELELPEDGVDGIMILPPDAPIGRQLVDYLGAADTVVKAGYTIQMTATPFPAAPASCNGLAAGAAGQAFVAGADPTDASNVRFFATNANNVIYEDNSTLYPTMPEVGQPLTGHMLR